MPRLDFGRAALTAAGYESRDVRTRAGAVRVSQRRGHGKLPPMEELTIDSPAPRGLAGRMGIQGNASRLLVAFLVGCSSSSTTPGDAGQDAGQDVQDDIAVIDAGPPKAEFLYSYSYNSTALLALPVNLSTGALGASASFSGPSSCEGMQVSPSGKFLYVSDAKADAVSAFSIDATTGALAPIAGSPFSLGNPSGSMTGSVAIDPFGKFLYATDTVANNVVGFSVDGSTGTLTRLQGTAPTGTDPLGAVVEPRGRFLYVGNTNDPNGSISAYAISTSGSLTTVPGSPFSTISNGAPQFFAVHPSGKFLFVNLPGNTKPPPNVVGAYAIGANGALTPVPGSPYAVGSYPLGVALDSAGKVLYVANNLDGTISAFTVDANNGALTKLSGSPFSAGLGGGGLPRGPFDLRVDVTSTVLYSSDGNDPDLLGFSIDSNGALGAPVVTDTNGADSVFLSLAKVY